MRLILWFVFEIDIVVCIELVVSASFVVIFYIRQNL